MPNESGHLFGKSTNRNTNKKESVPAWASTLKPPVSMDTSLDTDTLDTNQPTVVSVETILETTLWKPCLLLLQQVLHRGVTADFGTNRPANRAGTNQTGDAAFAVNQACQPVLGNYRKNGSFRVNHAVNQILLTSLAVSHQRMHKASLSVVVRSQNSRFRCVPALRTSKAGQRIHWCRESILRRGLNNASLSVETLNASMRRFCGVRCGKFRRFDGIKTFCRSHPVRRPNCCFQCAPRCAPHLAHQSAPSYRPSHHPLAAQVDVGKLSDTSAVGGWASAVFALNFDSHRLWE